MGGNCGATDLGKKLGTPLGMLGGADRLVLENLADRKKNQSGQALGVEANVHLHLVLEVMDPAVADHAEALPFDQEIARRDDTLSLIHI